jgi:hypothetical protein
VTALALDQSVLRFFVEHRSGALTLAFKLATQLGSSAVLIPFIVLIGVAYWMRRREIAPPGLLASS